MKARISLLSILAIFFLQVSQSFARQSLHFFAPDHPFIQYTGRIDFSNPQLPRFWQPAVMVYFRFKGEDAEILINDEQLWGSNQNYIELVVDGKSFRLQTKSKHDTLSLKPYLQTGGVHDVILCKNTEANIGWLELAGIRCAQLVKPPGKPARKMECIGNSITCGTGSDLSVIPCGKGKWQDQHNAWLSYGAFTSRILHAQVHLSAVSGIGLMHSCCKLDIIMPQVFDKVSMRNDTINWDFSRYQPDIVTVCLGQNDGIEDSAAFCSDYIRFIDRLRSYYPKARILLISSPMADLRLREFLRSSLLAVTRALNKAGDKRISMHVFEKSYNGGCDNHPSVAEHALIAAELSGVIRKWMKW